MLFSARNMEGLIASMTLEEKVSLLSGKDFWYTKAIERLGIESWMMTDGPHGMRKQATAADHLGLNASVPSTCFPSGSALAATWNPELIEKMGKAIGAEAHAENVRVILGPAVNMKRSPLCGRNFEYFSEDPHLAGELAKAHIRGIQSKGVGASIKHFAVNNQERFRMVKDALVDERAFREIYLPAFETAVKEAKPWTVICAYNKINGSYCSENKKLLTDILREEWGFDGVLITDWGACNDRVAGLVAGQDLEMPGNGGVNDETVIAAVKDGTLDEKFVNRAVARLLTLHARVTHGDGKKDEPVDHAAHHALARDIAREAVVLLKNEGNILPLNRGMKIALIGAFAEKTRYQGGGSSQINPTKLETLKEELEKSAAAGELAGITYCSGYRLDDDKPKETLIEEAKKAAREADVAIVCAGLTDTYESEGFDRMHMRMPEAHVKLIENVAEVQRNTVVVLSNGSPVEMPWIGGARAVVEGYLAGQAGAGAIADILTGKTNPSGKLAETFPLRLEDTPCFLNFPGDRRRVEYREGIFIGYRWYDSARLPVLFPFGHGLSYTDFEYANLTVSSPTFRAGDTLTATVTVRNSGKTEGKETVQFYVRHTARDMSGPEQELKGFAKVELKPGESKQVDVELDWRAFAWFDTERDGWAIIAGDFEIRAASSSRDIRLTATVRAEGTGQVRKTWTRNDTLADVLACPEKEDLAKKIRAQLGSMFGESANPGSAESLMREAMFREMPLRGLVQFGGPNAKEKLDEFLSQLNE